MFDGDRRAHEREPVQRPCKLYIPRTARYLTASTRNMGEGGALLQLEQPAVLVPGDRMFVGIAMTRRQPVLASNDMVEARVVRVVTTATDGVALAVRFVESSCKAAYLHVA